MPLVACILFLSSTALTSLVKYGRKIHIRLTFANIHRLTFKQGFRRLFRLHLQANHKLFLTLLDENNNISGYRLKESKVSRIWVWRLNKKIHRIFSESSIFQAVKKKAWIISHRLVENCSWMKSDGGS